MNDNVMVQLFVLKLSLAITSFLNVTEPLRKNVQATLFTSKNNIQMNQTIGYQRSNMIIRQVCFYRPDKCLPSRRTALHASGVCPAQLVGQVEQVTGTEPRRRTGPGGTARHEGLIRICLSLSSITMKVAVVLVCLSLAVMVAMIFQAMSQEYKLHALKARMVENSMEVKRKEDAIIEVKSKISTLKTSLKSITTKMDELKKKKDEIQKSTQELENGLQSCNKNKEETTQKRNEMAESITKLKADHDAAKTKAQEDIKTLKQQILDRDKAICAFADTTKEEARKLCGIAATN